MDNQFDLLKATLQEYDQLGKLGQIFTSDESGFPLNPKPPKGTFDKETKIRLHIVQETKHRSQCQLA